MGFDYFAFSNLETGNRDFAAHAVKKGNMIISFESPAKPGNCSISKFLHKHGDNIGDIVLEVEDCEKIYKNAVSRGAQGLKPPTRIEDKAGYIITATISVYQDVIHTLIEKVGESVTDRRTTMACSFRVSSHTICRSR